MIVVTGASGNVGQHLVEVLVSRGEQVRAVARGETRPISEVRGATVVRGDLADPEALGPVLDGADAFFLLLPGAGVGIDVPRLLELAATAGVERTVLVSSQAAGTRPDSPSHAPLAAIEEQVRAAGAGWTILRPGGFHTNCFAWVPTIRAEKAVYAPFGDVALPSVDPADIAEVAAAALTGAEHEHRTYVLTGPAAITPRERAQAIGEAVGHPLRFVDLDREQAREQMLRLMPPPVADGTLDILGQPTPEETVVSPDVERVLGRPGRTFADWAERHSGVFA